MSLVVEQLSPAEIETRITEILETGSLYQELRFTGPSKHYLPNLIQYFCPQCEKRQTYALAVNRASTSTDKGFQQRSYRCRNCNVQTVHFAYFWDEQALAIDGKQVVFTLFRKHGQFPPLEERISSELEKALKGSDDLEFYKSALRLRNFGLANCRKHDYTHNLVNE